MSGYFGFRRLISSTFVKLMYFLGFLAITGGGAYLAGLAAWQLHQATIDKRLGVYYVASGVGMILIGNIVWRMLCEVLIVLFSIYHRLVSIDEKMSTAETVPATESQAVKGDREVVYREVEPTATVRDRSLEPARPASVLGLT